MRKLTASSCLILWVFLRVVGKSFALPACPSSGFFHNCFGTWAFDSGDKYVGEFKNNKFHGRGTYYYLADNQFKGDKYVGGYKDGKMHGRGTYTYANGSKNVVAWENGRLLND